MPVVLAHPRLAVVAVLLSLGVMPALARFFFGSLREFLDEAGMNDDTGRWLWLWGWPAATRLYPQIIGFLGACLAVAWVVYEALAHVADWMHR